MMEMLHNEVRELLVRGYGGGTHDAEGIAKAYSVSKWTVYRLVEQKRKTESVSLRISQRGRKPLLTQADKERIHACIRETPDITMDELREKLDLKASYSTVERTVNGMGYTYKKKSLHAAGRERPRFAGETHPLKERIKPELLEHLAFLDESGVNTNLTRLYGWNLSSKRVVDHAPLNTPRSTTVLSSIRLTGEKAFTTYVGGATGERFVAYLRETLISTLKPGDIIIMDNMCPHHAKAAGELLRQNSMMPLYLLLYNPDLSPIEMMWSKMKLLLRKWKIRKPDDLPAAVHRALDHVSLSDVLHWFSFSGIVDNFDDCYRLFGGLWVPAGLYGEI